MDIKTQTEQLKKEIRAHRRYRQVASETGINYDWITKFAYGRVPNPGVLNVSKLQQYFVAKNASSPSVHAIAEPGE